MSGTVEGSLNYYDNQMGCGTAADKAIAARLGGHSESLRQLQQRHTLHDFVCLYQPFGVCIYL